MTSYDGQTITYDGMGNPLNYRDGITFTWKNGRRMESSTVGSIVTTYDYDIDGNRVERNGAGYRRKYTVIDGVTLGEQITFGGKTHTMEYMRDENGEVYGFIYDRSTYFLEKNALGDVKYLLDASGNVLAKYTYDEWGKKISVTDENGNLITDGTNIAHLNPFRYRSYYYDNETGLYYLNSRYYDPCTGRFVNADILITTDNNTIGINLYIYCGNNPVNRTDANGFFWKEIKNWVSKTWETVKKDVSTLWHGITSSTSFETEAGFGIGASAEICEVVEVEALAVVNRDRLFYENNEAGLNREMEYSAELSLASTFVASASAVYYVDFDEVQKSHRFYTNPNGKWDASAQISVNNVPLKNDIVFSVGAKAYLIFGVGYGASFNVSNFLREIGAM